MRYFVERGNRLIALFSSSFFGSLIYLLSPVNDPLNVLAISLVIHELLTTYFFFPEQSRAFSRRLGSNEAIIMIKSKIGRFSTTLLCILLPFIISSLVLVVASYLAQGSALDYWSDGNSRFIVTVILLGLMIDPIAYVFFEIPFWDTWTIIFGYLSILMVAIGSVSGRTGEGIFLIALVVALLNVRQTFVIHFHYKENADISFLAPSMFALFVALLPNILVVMEILEG